MRDGVLARCGLSEIITPTQTLAEDVRAYADAGVGAIGVWIHKLERDRIDGFWIPQERIPDDVVASAGEAIRASGLRVSHLILTGFYTGPASFEESVDHTLHLIDVADAIGADAVVVAPGRRNGHSYEETRSIAARALTKVLERTTKPDVRLALEPIVEWQSDYLNTLGEALELAELVDHPSLGVYVDTFHLWRTGTLLEDIDRAGDRIFGVHVNDWEPGDDHANRLPGDGVIPLADVLRAVEATGYRGTYDNEYMYDARLVDSEPERYAPDAVVARVTRSMERLLEEVLT